VEPRSTARASIRLIAEPGLSKAAGNMMPCFGLELLDMARDVAAFNLPARVGQLFGVSL
jgi:hypothetical protein